MHRTRIAHALEHGQPGEQIEVRGWVRTRRDSKDQFSFVELNDGSAMANLQVIVDHSVPGYDETIKRVTTGASVAVSGVLKESPGKGQRIELHASTLELLGAADPETFPLQKKRHSFEFLREIAHLRPRTNTFGAIARVRNALSAAIHNFFQSRGFLYVQTPIITTSDCEGAGEMFQVTTLNLEQLAGRRARPLSRTLPASGTVHRFRPSTLNFQPSTTLTTSSAAGRRSPSAASSKRRSSPRRWASATRSGRHSVPRTRTRPGTSRSSG